MSFIFCIASVFNLTLFSLKIYRLKYEEIGFLKKVIFVILNNLIIYNILYCSETRDNILSKIVDSFINSSMHSLFLFLNLVLMDS